MVTICTLATDGPDVHNTYRALPCTAASPYPLRGNYKGGRIKQKCVVFRSAVAAASPSASVSMDTIANRNKTLLNEAKAIWAINKAAGIGYDGDEDEVISKIAEMRVQDIG